MSLICRAMLQLQREMHLVVKPESRQPKERRVAIVEIEHAVPPFKTDTPLGYQPT